MHKHKREELTVKLAVSEVKLNLVDDRLHPMEVHINNIKKLCLIKIIENEQLEERLPLLSS